MTNSEYLISDDQWIDYVRNFDRGECIIRFIFLWMKYNEYYDKTFASIKHDRVKAVKIAEKGCAQNIYVSFKNEALTKFMHIPREDGTTPRSCNNKNNSIDCYYNTENSTLEHFLKVIYKIRCNFFMVIKMDQVIQMFY